MSPNLPRSMQRQPKWAKQLKYSKMRSKSGNMTGKGMLIRYSDFCFPIGIPSVVSYVMLLDSVPCSWRQLVDGTAALNNNHNYSARLFLAR